jgi:hypothetical protein
MGCASCSGPSSMHCCKGRGDMRLAAFKTGRRAIVAIVDCTVGLIRRRGVDVLSGGNRREGRQRDTVYQRSHRIHHFSLVECKGP